MDGSPWQETRLRHKAFLRWNLNLNMDYLPPDGVKQSLSFLSFCWCCCSLKQYSFECQSKGFCFKGPQDSLLECTLDLTTQNTAGCEQVFSDVQCHWPLWHYSQEQKYFNTGRMGVLFMIKVPQSDEWPPRPGARKGHSLQSSCSCG